MATLTDPLGLPGLAGLSELPGLAEVVSRLLAEAADLPPRLAPEDLAVDAESLLVIIRCSEALLIRTVAAAQATGAVAAATSTTTAAWLREAGARADICVDPSEAKRIVDAAQMCAAAAEIPEVRPLADALCSGRFGLAVAGAVSREADRLLRLIPPGQADPVSGLESGGRAACIDGLIGYAARGASARQLAELRDALIARYAEPADVEERAAMAHRDRGMTSFRVTSSGCYVSTVRLDPTDHAVVAAALDALTKPQPCVDDRGRVMASDDRTADQRRADALVQLIAAAVAIPAAGAPGVPTAAKVMVTVPLSDLVAKTRHGLTDTEAPLDPAAVRMLACAASVVPVVLGSDSAPLDVGRAARLATPAQITALRLRDGGCTFPGCDRPPKWTDAHHIRHWSEGGPTNLDNLALLCRRHHRVVHRDRLSADLSRHETTGRIGVRWSFAAPEVSSPVAA